MADDPGARRVLMGEIVAPHGVRGEVRLKSYAEPAANVAAYGPLLDERGRTWPIEARGEVRGLVVARLGGIADRDAAEALRGLRLYVPRSALPPPASGEWYEADLVGLKAVGVDGRDWGEVVAVLDFGAGTMIEVSGGAYGKSVVLPFTDEATPTVDVAGGMVTVDPPAGLLDEPGGAAKRKRRRSRQARERDGGGEASGKEAEKSAT
jgi:16S rRNA processing protein RimM